MDERLNKAPCGFLSLSDDNTILEANQTFLDLFGYERTLVGCKFESILTSSSRIFYMIYFYSLMKLNGKIEEMYLSLRSTVNGTEVSVLLNAVRHKRGDGYVYDCILFPMRRRNEYEGQLLAAEEAIKKAKVELERVERALKSKQNELSELHSMLNCDQKPNVTTEHSLEQMDDELNR